MADVKAKQLGMNPSTASHRLVKDILWSLIVKTDQDSCCKCETKMERDNFSIEHLTPWLHSDNPAQLYFDLDNISFSHLRCNISDSRDGRKLKPCGTEASYQRGCRCDDCSNAKRAAKARRYTKESRHATYKRTGK